MNIKCNTKWYQGMIFRCGHLCVYLCICACLYEGQIQMHESVYAPAHGGWLFTNWRWCRGWCQWSWYKTRRVNGARVRQRREVYVVGWTGTSRLCRERGLRSVDTGRRGAPILPHPLGKGVWPPPECTSTPEGAKSNGDGDEEERERDVRDPEG